MKILETWARPFYFAKNGAHSLEYTYVYIFSSPLLLQLNGSGSGRRFS